ncbi:hypothetical protein MNEG_6884 [Monoraphidium neglectum]|jgi:hypothetical protein|uniref:Uncharacterized protein n=1 Tax=Monoraphidium neglectum TaxID=145388 RepID=A0A0D2JPN1_9CHLO|nr:hypothetical protein MNEG_6884 [Monoraphidium neglectum]KIZ01078.1 hypothetical protein MNEG_6884 [Monoraphidium neglectum]|eukprot:XP_013900097.1 hypothetical protein MNEG_6884 [Monoraphidium neglectum]
MTHELLRRSAAGDMEQRPTTVAQIEGAMLRDGIIARREQAKQASAGPGEQTAQHNFGGPASGTPILIGPVSGPHSIHQQQQQQQQQLFLYAVVTSGSWKGGDRQGGARRYMAAVYPGDGLAEQVRQYKNETKQRKAASMAASMVAAAAAAATAAAPATSEAEGQQQEQRQKAAPQQEGKRRQRHARQVAGGAGGVEPPLQGLKPWDDLVPGVWLADAAFYCYTSGPVGKK